MSDDCILADYDGVAFLTDESFIVSYDYVFVQNGAVKGDALLDLGFLHNDRVGDRCTFADLDATEDYAVFDDAVDGAAVGDDGIANLCFGSVDRRDLVFDLGVYGGLGVKHLGIYRGV